MVDGQGKLEGNQLVPEQLELTENGKIMQLQKMGYQWDCKWL